MTPGVVMCRQEQRDFRVVFSNRAFTDLTGFSCGDIAGASFARLLGDDIPADQVRHIRETLAGGQPYKGTLCNQRKSGPDFWSEVCLNPVRSEAGDLYVVGTVRDIDDRIELEARLGSAQRLGTLGKLAGGIAHDFNNLLGLILGNAQIVLDEGGSNPNIKEAATDIANAARSGTGLIRRMLRYAKGQQTGKSRFAVNESIAEVSDMLKRSMTEPIAIGTDFDATLGMVKLDRTLFKTAVINLLLNARDAITAPGKIIVRTRLRQDTDTPWVEVAVVDTGSGMTREIADRALDPFFTTKTPDRGTGLGLSAVDSFVRQSGGELKIESTPGKGTTVLMVLPCETPRVAHAPQPAH